MDQYRVLAYQQLLSRILTNGVRKDDRTGVGTISTFGETFDHNMKDGFPLLTTKKVHWKSVVAELLWFIRGQTNIKDLDATIWNEWADSNGDLGPIYGKQWRDWGGIDQLAIAISRLRTHPNCRRNIVSAWNVAELDKMALHPCHLLYQFYTERQSNTLSLQMYQRSCDSFLGLPFNIASYALLLEMICTITDYDPGWLRIRFGDCHIYQNHLDQVNTLLGRTPKELPKVILIARGNIDDFTAEDIKLIGYEPWPKISAPVAV